MEDNPPSGSGGSLELKVCLLSYEFPPYLGGEACYTEGLAISLSRTGIETEVVTPSRGGLQTADLPEGPKVVRLAGCQQKPLGIASFQAACSIYLSRMGCDADIVHQTSDYFFPLPSRKPVDVVTLSHPYEPEEELVKSVIGGKEAQAYLRRRHMRYLRSMQKMASVRVPHMVAISRFTAYTFGRAHGIPPERFRIEPPGILLERFDGLKDQHEARSSLGLEASGPLLLQVARLDHNKDLSTLLSAFGIIKEGMPECRLLIAGSGPLRQWFANSAERMGLGGNVVMIGPVSSRVLIDAYSAADVVILSSLMEGFGIVLAEAMAAERPCVATRCGATEEVVSDGKTGFLVPPRDTSSLAGAILSILGQPDLGRRFGKAGRRRVERMFDWSFLATRMAAYYEQVEKGDLA